jgi:uncharacterized protein YceK
LFGSINNPPDTIIGEIAFPLLLHSLYNHAVSNLKQIIMYKPLFILLLGLLLSGCGTIVALINPTKPYSAYAGVKYDYAMAQRWGLPILDIPLSFILDTALLPYALTNSQTRDE